MECSIVLSTRNKAAELRLTLGSIFRQEDLPEMEVIVVDDGSTDETGKVCECFINQGKRLNYVWLMNKNYRNPSVARNVGYKMAQGGIIICQSDDVIHAKPDTVRSLMSIKEGCFNIATVMNVQVSPTGELERRRHLMTGRFYQRPFFFLGSLYRADLYAVGGNCEDFNLPGYDDDWFADCLMKGLGLICHFRDDVEGWHQRHERPSTKAPYAHMKALYDQKKRDAERGIIDWSAGPAWPLTE